MKSAAIMDLVAGYETYSNAQELEPVATADAPATAFPCSTVAVSILQTIARSC